jgi:Ca2+-binding EF-hand superfamily protein
MTYIYKTATQIFVGIMVVTASVIAVAAEIDPDTLETLKTRFAAADKDHDGKLTREECEAGMPRIFRGFDKIDTTKVGYITLDQIITFVAQR